MADRRRRSSPPSAPRSRSRRPTRRPPLAGAAGLRARALAAGRVTDGEALYASAVTAAAGGVPDPPLPPQASDPAVAAVLAAFVAFRAGAFSEPAGDAAWQANDAQLRVRGGVGVDDRTAGRRCSRPTASAAGIWTGMRSASAPASRRRQPQAPAYAPSNFLPLHVTFRGMPDGRWWAFEDSVTDFGQLDAEPRRPGQAAGDGVRPGLRRGLVLRAGARRRGVLQRVTTLVVTDTFGMRTLIRPVEQMPVAGGQPWSMFKISAGDGTLSDFILLPPPAGLVTDADADRGRAVPARQHGGAWPGAVEQQARRGRSTCAVDGYEQYLARLRLDPSATPPTPVAGGADIAYTVEHAVPDNWIPMLPVLSSSGELLLRRGTMDVPGPGGTVVQLQAHSSILQPGAPYYLTERVVNEIGVDVRSICAGAAGRMARRWCGWAGRRPRAAGQGGRA